MKYLRQADADRIQRELLERIEAAMRELPEQLAHPMAEASDVFTIRRIWRGAVQAIEARELAWARDQMALCEIEALEGEEP